MTNVKSKSSLQKLKTNWMAYENTNDSHLPRSMTDLKNYKKQQYGIQFMEQYVAGKVNSKKEYCKIHKVSTHTLDTGLRYTGSMPPVKHKDLNGKKKGVSSDEQELTVGKRRKQVLTERSSKGGQLNNGNMEERVIVNERGETVSELADRCMRELERRH